MTVGTRHQKRKLADMSGNALLRIRLTLEYDVHHFTQNDFAEAIRKAIVCGGNIDGFLRNEVLVYAACETVTDHVVSFDGKTVTT